MNAARHRGIALKNTIWKAAKACTCADCRNAMKELRAKFPEAIDWSSDENPIEWSKSYFLKTSRCDQLLNNSCESFNNCILEARDKPIITMLEWIREYLIIRLQECRETTDKWEGILCPKIEEIVQRHEKKLGGCRPIKASRVYYQISCVDGGQYAVDLYARSCSHKRWQLSGIPCKHVLSAICNEKLDAVDFMDACYYVETYKKVYAGVIIPISGHELWGETMYIPPLPPKFGKKAGRPAKLRRRGLDEPNKKKNRKWSGKSVKKLRRFQITIHCSFSGEPGHNLAYCPEIPNSYKEKLH